VTSPSRRIRAEEDIVGRIYGARDLLEAVAIFFERVLTPAGVERAFVLREEEGTLRGVLGMELDQEVVRAISIPLASEAHPLVGVFLGGGAVTVDFTPDHETGSAEPFLAFQLPGEVEGGRAFGLLLFPAPEREPAAFDGLARRLPQIGAALAHVAEGERMRRTQRQLEQQRDLLTAIVNALPDPVLITDIENSILLENRRAETLFTASEGDSEGRRRAVEINNLLFSSFLTRSTIGGFEGRELNLVDPVEGADLLFEVLSTPLPTAIWEQATVSVLRDVTDLRRATTELEHQFKRVRQAEVKSRRERDRLNLILENVGDPILVTDDQANIILMNREAERLFDIPTGAETNPRRRQQVRANDTKFSSLVSDFALGPDPTRTTQLDLTEPGTGRVFPAEVVSGKVLNERSEMTAVVSILHDLTKVVENERLALELTRLNESLEDRIRAATLELEERNRQLEWQRQELERAYRLKSQFLASMSHELRTPINALLGYTSLMRDHIYGDLNRRQDEALSRMATASQHLLELVNDILDLAKIEAGKMPVHVETVDIGFLIRELSQTIEPMIRRKHLEYRLDLDPATPPLETDRTKVKQIMLNLLSNAVKFTQRGHVAVRVRPAERADGVEIEVVDSGIGIEAEDVPKIFEDFRQVDQSSTREYGGTGLGLSITKKLLHLLGGTIHVESAPGRGSTFTVWLPYRSQEIVLDEEIARVARAADDAVIE
jgi:signal transduction histidine kinase